MSFPQRISPVTDSITLALWRAAEEGALDELTSVLPRVRDINARNEHGVTALMRAAQFGHEKVVRVLLDHGADANITRNDKFTALALAAFFGHTEIVRTLMEHGADSKASTRHGTSPHMWATARTFNEVVDQLETPAPPKPVQRVARVIAEVRDAPVNATPRVIRTLKDPPEIWDLVHEVPKGFDARSAFMSRLNSMRKGLAFRVATVGVLIAVIAVGVGVLRRSAGRSQAKVESQPIPVSVDSRVNETQASVPVVPAAEVREGSSTEETTTPAVTRRFSTVTGRSLANSAHRVKRDVPERSASSEEVQPATAKSEKTDVPVRSEPATGSKVSAPLSPQLISPAKNASPKAKVIQWP
ncbi:MAG TPA: ankyrin repeat domain-containing protein [Pyrinomonadaceae bacterium]|nr:ankyrin repeat domain-containing protein [Pyrinomonadaceae bacterium]